MDEIQDIAFFDLDTSGHHAEYLYHLVNYGLTHENSPTFTLIIHPDAINLIGGLGLPSNWQNALRIVHPTDEEINKLKQKSSSLLRASYEFQILQRVVNELSVEHCCLMSLNKFQFILGTRKGKNLPCNISGILFNPFGNTGKRMHNLFLVKRKHAQMKWLLRNNSIYHIYLLNDEELVNDLNQKYSLESTFINLPDPILLINEKISEKQSNLKSNISNKTKFLIFGSLAARKGIYLVLDALRALPESVTKDIEINFAGKLVAQDDQRFRSELSRLKVNRPSLIIRHIDEFIPYEQISNLFSETDCVLVPYVGSQASSGVLGHAALYEKPVIGPKNGLVGKLIQKYDLGLVVDRLNTQTLVKAITYFMNNRNQYLNKDGMKNYISDHHPYKFVEVLSSNFKHNE